MSDYPRTMAQEEHKFKEKPHWLDSFVKKTFGDPCRAHVLIKNDRNRYCINCDLAVCQYCIDSGSHNGHNILRLYRHVYQDVVPVSDMAHYIDCSKIQPYKCNKLWVLSLKPLPHNDSGSKADTKSTCDTCRRILSYPYLHRYCSLDCKVQAFSRKTKSSDPPFLTVRKRAAADDRESVAASTNPSITHEFKEGKRNRRRKGTPQRSPFF
ncbi:hypothetical protein ACET3Z_000785 [Daucus carota]